MWGLEGSQKARVTVVLQRGHSCCWTNLTSFSSNLEEVYWQHKNPLITTSCLIKQSFKVWVGECYASKRPLNGGVSQGLVLGPILYNLHTPVMFQKTYPHKALYAQDTAIFISLSTTHSVRMVNPLYKEKHISLSCKNQTKFDFKTFSFIACKINILAFTLFWCKAHWSIICAYQLGMSLKGCC